MPAIRYIETILPYLGVKLVQSATTTENTSSITQAVTLPGPSTTGNTLIVCVTLYGRSGGADIPNCTGVADGTNTFTRIAAADMSQAGHTWGQRTAIYVSTNITGRSSEVITATFNEAPFSWLHAWETTPATFDQALPHTGTGPASTSQAVTPGSLTPSANGAFFISTCQFDPSNGTFTSNGSGWTFLLNSTAGGGSAFSASKPQSTATAENASFQILSAANTSIWGMDLVSFIPPPVVIKNKFRMVV